MESKHYVFLAPGNNIFIHKHSQVQFSLFSFIFMAIYFLIWSIAHVEEVLSNKDNKIVALKHPRTSKCITPMRLLFFFPNLICFSIGAHIALSLQDEDCRFIISNGSVLEIKKFQDTIPRSWLYGNTVLKGVLVAALSTFLGMLISQLTPYSYFRWQLLSSNTFRSCFLFSPYSSKGMHVCNPWAPLRVWDSRLSLLHCIFALSVCPSAYQSFNMSDNVTCFFTCRPLILSFLFFCTFRSVCFWIPQFILELLDPL